MSEAIVTIKLTESELKIINNMFYSVKMLVNNYAGAKQDPSVKLLQNQLLKIEEWIGEEKRKANIDKKVSEESSKERIQDETSERICVPCDD